MTEAYATQNNLKTTSDLANFLKKKPDQAVFCLETEFTSRQDGFPAAVKAYGFQQPQVKNFGIGTIYSAVSSGTCPVGEIFTTDGRISGLHLRVLEDDKQAFPQYNAVATLRTGFLDAHPDLRGPLEPVLIWPSAVRSASFVRASAWSLRSTRLFRRSSTAA